MRIQKPIALLFLASLLAASQARAAEKPPALATVLPAIPLGARQLADIAAKGTPVQTTPALPAALASHINVRTQAAVTAASIESSPRATAVASRKGARMPGVSEALGPIPRESWVRLALRKPADIAVIDGRALPIVTDGRAR